MVQLNRIGNKLGLAGGFGVLLSLGMLANQIMSQASVEQANVVADHHQRTAQSALAANVDLRQMQLQARSIRLTRTVAEVDKCLEQMRKFAASELEHIDNAYRGSQKPENKERFQKLKSLVADYAAGAEEVGKVQKQLFALIDRRNAAAGEWSK